MVKQKLKYSLLIFALMFAAVSWASDIVFGDADIRVEEGFYVVDVVQQYELNETLSEALENGVPLVFKMHIEIKAKDNYFWHKKKLNVEFRYVLRYRPLAAVYEVFPLGSQAKQTFATRFSALSALGEISKLKLIDAKHLDKDKQYMLSMQSELEIAALPLPLRPQAYISPEWHFNSGEYEWPL